MDKLMQRTAVDEFCAVLECLVSSMGQSQINANNSNLVYFLLGEWKFGRCVNSTVFPPERS